MLTFVLVHGVTRVLWKCLYSGSLEPTPLGTSSCAFRQPMPQVLWALEVPLMIVTQGVGSVMQICFSRLIFDGALNDLIPGKNKEF